MTAEELRRRKNAEPFVPFTLTLTDGRRVPVKGYWSFIVSPVGTSLIVTHAEVDVDIIATHTIASVAEELAAGVA